MSRNCRKCEICEKSEYGMHKANLFYATFPLDEDRCRMWIKLVGKPELVHLPIEKLHKTRYICGDHFERKAFNKKGSRLKKTAVPKLNLKYTPLTDDQLREFPQHMWNYKKASEVIASTSQTADLMMTKPSTNADLLKVPIPGSSKGVPDPIPSQQAHPIPSQPILMEDHTVAPSKKCGFTSTSKDTPSTSVTRSSKRKAEESLSPASLSKKQVVTPSTPKKMKLHHDTVLTPRKKKLMEQLRKTKCTVASLRKSANIIEKMESPVLKELVISTSKNQKRCPKGRRWTPQNKISCLAILKRSAKTYRYLRHIIPLPSVKTLQNIMKRLPMKTGINQSVIDYLKTISKDKSEKEKLCALLFDEIALKPRLIYNASTDQVDGFQDLGVSQDGCGRSADVADHALLFMIQGLYRKFKQPIALYFVKSTISSQKLAVLVKDIITAINDTDHRVLATICDQGPTNMGALKLLKNFSGPSVADNAFVVNNKKIFIVYDVPHLFKSIRNNFLKNGNIVFGGKNGKWSHLVEVEEKNRKFLYLSKITPTHVNPKYRAKMKVKYATQALSNTVSAVLKLTAEAEQNKGNSQKAESLLETALIVEDLDRLFDCTNGPSGPDDVKLKWRQNVSMKTDHLDKWANYEKKLKDMKFTNEMGTIAKNVKCVQGYIITLKSLRDIWLSVSNMGFKHLNLRQLNQDALENLFGIIRQHSPTNRNPTCAHFLAALKTAIITNMTSPHSRGSNCQKDGNQLLTNFQNLIFPEESCPQEENEKEVEPQKEAECQIIYPESQNEDEAPVISLADDQLYAELEEYLEREVDHAVVYVSGYVASRVLKNNACKRCEELLSVNDDKEREDPTYSYIKLREWWSDRQCLTYPSKKLCQLVEQATVVAEQEICSNMFQLNVGQLLMTLFSVQCETDWYSCHEHKKNVIQTIFHLLGQLFITRQCQRQNQGFALLEESLADAVKKAQQQGQAK